MNVWVVRAEFGKHADNFRNGGYVALDFDISEPYPIGEPREAFVEAFKKYNPSVTSNVVVGQQVGQITRFCESIQAGDYVITPSDNNDVLYYGRVLDEPYYFESAPTDACRKAAGSACKMPTLPPRRTSSAPSWFARSGSVALILLSSETISNITLKASGVLKSSSMAAVSRRLGLRGKLSRRPTF